MTSLSEFLLARIAEDEGHARVATPGPWESFYRDLVDHAEYIVGVVSLHGHDVLEDRDCFRSDANHIARHNPARVLAECEAKRRIIEGRPTDWDAIAQWEETIETLAAVYADHPDYREEWKP